MERFQWRTWSNVPNPKFNTLTSDGLELKTWFYLYVTLNKYTWAHSSLNLDFRCCHSKTGILAGLLKYTSDRRIQRLNRHQLVLVTWAVKKWPPSSNLKPGWVLQQMCLHGHTAAKKWGDVLERAAAYIKVAPFIHPSPLPRLNLCHIRQIHPSLGITVLAKKRVAP